MPKKSPFRVVLSKDERQHLESIARQYTSPYCDVIRAKIILLASQGLSNDVIASRLGKIGSPVAIRQPQAELAIYFTGPR
jgi:hypothetical protein